MAKPARKNARAAAAGGSQLFCDITQSWSEVGGGVRTYLLHKRRHILEATSHRHLMIIPGAKDEVEVDDRAITVRIKSPKVPGSPNYRLLLRNSAVKRIDPKTYTKPWTITVALQYQADDELIEYICNENNKYFEVVKDAAPPGRPAPRPK